MGLWSLFDCFKTASYKTIKGRKRQLGVSGGACLHSVRILPATPGSVLSNQCWKNNHIRRDPSLF